MFVSHLLRRHSQQYSPIGGSSTSQMADCDEKWKESTVQIAKEYAVEMWITETPDSPLPFKW